jgi:hypothetical protein
MRTTFLASRWHERTRRWHTWKGTRNPWANDLTKLACSWMGAMSQDIWLEVTL